MPEQPKVVITFPNGGTFSAILTEDEAVELIEFITDTQDERLEDEITGQ